MGGVCAQSRVVCAEWLPIVFVEQLEQLRKFIPLQLYAASLRQASPKPIQARFAIFTMQGATERAL